MAAFAYLVSRRAGRDLGVSVHSVGKGEISGHLTGPSVSSNLRFVETYQGLALDALGDPTRRAIFERLALGPTAVGELARELPVSRPAVSQHLARLKAASLVVDQAVGTRRLYRLNPQGIEALRAYFQQFWTDALTDFKAVAESEETP